MAETDFAEGVEVGKDPQYALSASSTHEHERLARQADWYGPFTRRLLRRAGIGPGMRVLDVGCGPGDVSFLLSELVGGKGSVVGIERDEHALAAARARAEQSQITNVRFTHGDFRDVQLSDGPFDALVGRLVLMYQGDPAAAIASAARHLRPGGVAAFAEMCIEVGSVTPERIFVSWPRTPASEQASRWIHDVSIELGTQLNMGLRLPEMFADAGLLPNPQLDAETAVASGEEAIERMVDLVRSLLPGMLATGVITEPQAQIDSLAERLRAGTGPAGRIVLWPTVIGAFATKPL